MSSLIKRLIRDKKKDIIHSSGYAKVQNGNSLGAASAESFRTRQEINTRRTFVKRYGDSEVGRSVLKPMERAKIYTPKAESDISDGRPTLGQRINYHSHDAGKTHGVGTEHRPSGVHSARAVHGADSMRGASSTRVVADARKKMFAPKPSARPMRLPMWKKPGV